MAQRFVKASVLLASVLGAASLAPTRPKHRHLAQKAAVAAASVNQEACVCKNWKQTYGNGTSCGAGQEFFFKTGKSKPDAAKLDEAKQALGLQICAGFYEKLDHNRCVNLNVGSDQGQWCYVDAACGNLNFGGRLPNSALAWKGCTAGQDPSLRDLSPEDIGEAARGADIELGLFHKMAYPLSKAWQNKRFPEVQAFWGVGDAPADSLPAWVQKDMKKIADTQRPYSFDNALDEHTPHTIVVGMKVYTVEDSPTKDESHPGTWETLRCIKGC